MRQRVDDKVERIVFAADEDTVRKTLDHAHDCACRTARIDRARAELLLQSRDALAELIDQKLDKISVVVLAEKWL